MTQQDYSNPYTSLVYRQLNNCKHIDWREVQASPSVRLLFIKANGTYYTEALLYDEYVSWQDQYRSDLLWTDGMEDYIFEGMMSFPSLEDAVEMLNKQFNVRVTMDKVREI